MSDDDTQDPGVHIKLRPADAPGFAAIVRLCGEHDLATGADLRAELAPIHGSVLIDLSACAFIDSTVIGILIANQHERELEGQRLELLVPAENAPINRTLEVSGVRQLLNVRSEMP